MTDTEALVQLGIALGELKARVARLTAERDAARGVILRAEAMVNGHMDNDYEISQAVLRPYLASIEDAT